MNKSLKFLAIGLALAVLLVSQVGVNRTDTTEAAVDLSDEMVEFTDEAGNTKDFFKPGDTARFYLKDDSLALPTANNRATVTWIIPATSGNVDDGDTFNLVDGTVKAGATPVTGTTGFAYPNDPSVSSGNGPDAGLRRLADLDDDPETDDVIDPDTVGRSSKYDNYAPEVGDPAARDAAQTPIVGDITLTYEQGATAADLVEVAELGVRRINRNAGTFQLDDAGVDFASGMVTVIKAVFEYEVADVFEAKHTGTAASTENRAKVISSSDGVGDWVTIREVADEGDPTAASRSHIYYGEIELVADARAASESPTGDPGTEDYDAGGTNKVWVRDGDALTITIYEDDHVTVIDSDEATIDAEDPSITGFDPVNNAKLDDTAPPVSFTMSDDGAGFDTKTFTNNVDLIFVKGGTTACRIDAEEDLTATSLTQPEVDVLFRISRNWGTEGVGPCVSAGATEEAVTALRESAGLADTVGFQGSGRLVMDTTALGDNNHGVPFDIIAVSTDGAGNTGMAKVTVTIDTVRPSIVLNDSRTGVTWDAAKNEEANSRAAIRVAFDESLRPDTVDADDFTVKNPDMEIESVIVGSGMGNAPENKDEYVYLVLAGDLASDARPRVELDGSIRDVAGNELRRDTTTLTRVSDKIKPKVTVGDFSAQLLAEKGESTITFSADENMGATASGIPGDCTCLVITGGGKGTAQTIGSTPAAIAAQEAGVTKGAVSLPTPSTGRHTFKQSGRDTGIYGVLVQASDSQAQVSVVGAVKVTNEAVAVKAADVSTDPADETVKLKLKNWPLTDSNTDGSLADEVELRTSVTAAPATSTVKSVDWENGTVTVEFGGGLDSAILESSGDAKDGTVYVTYSYVHADQVIQVDTDAPSATFMPEGDTQEARPFIRIQFDDAEYAGDTHTTVTVTSATLTDPDGNETVLVDEDMNLLSTSDNKLFSYLPPSDLALGEYTISAVGRDAAGNASEETSGKFKVIARPKVTIPLTLGWNLIALPAAPTDMSIDTVIDVAAVETVLTYDPTVEGGWQAAVRVNGSFEGALTMIDATKAYLIYTTSEQDLKVDIPGLARGVLPPAVQLYAGWNLVPSSSLDPAFPARDVDDYFSGLEWTRGYYYDSDGRLTGFTPGTGAGATSNDELVVKGRGFFLYLTEDGTLVP